MTERIFVLQSGLMGTQFAHPTGVKLQLDSPNAKIMDLNKETAQELGLALLKWASGSMFNHVDIYIQDYRKGFELSVDCPRCELQIDLFSFRKRQW